MTVRLIATDMDGTFLNDQKTYDKVRFHKLLERMAVHDIHFVVASGNQYCHLVESFPDIKDNLTFIGENGSHIVHQGETLFEMFQPHEEIAELVQFIESNFPETVIALTGKTSAYMLKSNDEDSLKTLRHYLPKLELVDSFSPIPRDDFFKSVLLMEPELTREIQVALNHHFESGSLIGTSSGFGCIDVITKGYHKGWALQRLLDEWGLTSENLMVFGDGENDLSMLKLAKYSYAMSNAPENIKAHANFQTSSNNEDGVLQAIEEYLNKIERNIG